MMRTYKLLAAGIGTLLLGFLTATPTQAAITALVIHSGLNCAPKPGDASKLAYNLGEGIRSTSATATVFCPAW